MIKTLRITGVAAVAFAGVVLASVLGPVSLIHLDNRNDRQMAKILDAPSAVERFQKQHAGSNQVSQDTKPPLVKQAEFFKDLIDPKLPVPAASTPASSAPVRSSPVIKPLTTSPKFALIGTSCSPSHPNSSFAYIRFLDNTFQWVQCGSEVGHLLIKEVRESSVICWDGNRESEIAMEPVPERASLLEADNVASAPAASQPVEVNIVEPPAGQPALARAQAVVPGMSDDEQEALGDLVERLKGLQSHSGNGNPATHAEQVAAANKLISEFQSSRVSPQETRKLEGLGNEPNRESERAREEQKREYLRRKLDAIRSSKK